MTTIKLKQTITFQDRTEITEAEFNVDDQFNSLISIVNEAISGFVKIRDRSDK